MQQGKIAAAAAMLALACQAAFAAPADDVKALVEQNKSKEAYELGSQHPELLGNPEFDFYFGVAAVDDGHAGEGVLALERYLIQFPANRSARIELARAYFVLGEDARAREEFENVLKQSPPADVQLAVQRYLDAIRVRESRYRTTSLFYVEAGFGYDSNVNGGVSNANISLPVLGTVTVADAGIRKHDRFGNLAAGGQITHPVSPGFAVFGGFAVDAKINSREDEFNLLNSALAGGLSVIKDKDLYKLSASHSSLVVDTSRFRDINGVNGDWHHQLDELQSIQTSVQLAKFDYTGTNQVRNADYAGAGVNYRRVIVYKWQPVVNLGINLAKEHNTEGRPDLGRDIAGVRAGLGVTPGARWGVNAGLTYLDSHYSAPDAFLGETRRDRYYAFDGSVVYLVNKNWSARCELLVSNNRSNLSLYEYARDVVALKLRYEFK
jgi:outer membrane protein